MNDKKTRKIANFEIKYLDLGQVSSDRSKTFYVTFVRMRASFY